MSEFPYERLRRFPDVEAPELQAHDATDLLLVERCLAHVADHDLTGSDIAVIGDGYGAITLALVDAGLRGIRLHQDLATGRRALVRNAEELGMLRTLDADGASAGVGPGLTASSAGDGAPFVPHELDAALLTGVRLVLLQLPKALAELAEIADAVARWAADDVVLIAGGRVKHMTLAQNEILARSFARVQPQRAERKSRLIVAEDPRDVPEAPPFPVRETHPEFGVTLAAHGGAFAGARIDVGTRVLLDVLTDRRSQLLMDGPGDAREGADSADCGRSDGQICGVVNEIVIDLGCGTGVLAAVYALTHPDARVIATDRSAAAVASARATMAANGVADRVQVTHDDAGSDLPDASADVVLLNPPFHLGTSVHTAAATRLFDAAARLLRSGGELWTVYNSSLAYKGELTRRVGRTEQVHRTPKFTVTRSIRSER
ncbi:methyltransferase [Microbacterium sp. M28]|uniref:class I SAM-dependent methyltransferase n=1 Tax=Microbacterium sp. M28 TaxID=2962064 RepID=UPI0021F466FE|nr:methyltransferase [Microbacterium sp. M28]UYO96929.1 methyltransferase [Microbacterium sp. M28]